MCLPRRNGHQFCTVPFSLWTFSLVCCTHTKPRNRNFASSPLSFSPSKSTISIPFSPSRSFHGSNFFISLFSTRLFANRRASARVLIENRYWRNRFLSIWDGFDRSSSSPRFEIYILRDHSNNWRRESWIVTIVRGIEVFGERLLSGIDVILIRDWKGKLKSEFVIFNFRFYTTCIREIYEYIFCEFFEKYYKCSTRRIYVSNTIFHLNLFRASYYHSYTQ